MRNLKNTRVVVYVGILIALEIILTRFVQINLPFSKDRVSIGFLPVAVSGALFGPVIGGITAGIADVIRANILAQGDFNPLFTLSAALRGVIYGLFLYKHINFKRILFSSALIFIFINSIMNSYIVHLWYGTPFDKFLMYKIIASAINFLVQLVVLNLVLPIIKKNINLNWR